ncbi:TetR/AcrR family transcriptional regulator [Streptomyces montanisoli]|uniref:TetR/AcrR family transcriptional regulator n=1 Tax=Streptomyces montanisoli TaxID=2798581 RepID=A0A940RWJ7_9ACTN|nr:TetR/AcrR family transcriptional regulator [Streptomyces montanisoli]MBP0457193.1 TetR/AcrR family transcriptional regulator [Streptomyces montanisoli]
MPDSPEAQDAPGRRRGSSRRRGAALLQAIFLATLEELAETSYEELSFDKVAARAGTGKTTLYRRWSTTAELVLAALSDPGTGFPPPAAPGTGSLRGDLTTVLAGLARGLQEPRGRALRPLITQRPRHPELFDEVFRALIVPHQGLLLDILRAAAERGEARPAAVTQRMASLGPRLIVMESMQRDSVPLSEVAAIVDEVLLPLAATRP